MSHLNKILIAMVAVVLLGATSALAQEQFTTGGSFQLVRGEGQTESVGQVSLLASNAGTIITNSAINLTYSAPITEWTNLGVTCVPAVAAAGCQLAGATFAANTVTSVSGTQLTIQFTGNVGFAPNDQIIVAQVRVNASAVASTGTTQITSTPSSVSANPVANPITFTPAFSNIVVGIATLPSSTVSISTTSITPTPIGVPLAVLTCAPPAGVALAAPVVNFSFNVKEAIPNAWTTTAEEITYTPSYAGAGTAVNGPAPTQGSWISISFAGVPAGFTLSAVSVVSKTGTTVMNIVSAGTAVATGGTAPLGVIGTAATAVSQTVAGAPIVFTYQVTASNLSQLDTGTFGFMLEATPSAVSVAPGGLNGPVTATVAYAPVNQPSPTTAVNALPLVRFNPTNTIGTLTVATVSDCLTRLLHSWVLGGNGGYDTGIAIANTSLDTPAFTAPNVAIPQNGTCILTGFPFTGNGSPVGAPIQTTTVSIAAGTQWANNLSQVPGFSGFRGALLVVCNFLNAHDFVFITNGFGSLTGPGLAEGYLGLVVPNLPRVIALGEGLVH